METNTSPLEGQVAIVTGASRGIGKAIAIGYADAGASVCCAARTVSDLDETVAQIKEMGKEAFAIEVDVTQWEAAQKMVDETVSRLGGVDIIVINAGVGDSKTELEASDPQRWTQVINTNLIGAYYCAKAAIPALKKRGGGKIITVGSGIRERFPQKSSDYSCSKAALWAMVKVLSKELRPFNITVNELIPGYVRSGMNTRVPEGGGITDDGEWAKMPEDVVPWALFMATQPLIGPTGQSFNMIRRD